MAERYKPHPVSSRIDRVPSAAYDEHRPPWLSQFFMIRDVPGGNACGAWLTLQRFSFPH
jgi:hypothetical protein